VPWPTTFLDVEGAIKGWVNAQTATLVGPGHPIPLGAHVGTGLRSPARGCYLLLTRVGGGPDPGEANVDQARLSSAVYGMKKLPTALAAAAYANLLVSVTAPVPLLPSGRLMAVTDVSGPLYIPDGDEERYLVDAVFHIQPS
jgi:hypothetical protein